MTDGGTERHQVDLISFLSFFQNKESRIKTYFAHYTRILYCIDIAYDPLSHITPFLSKLFIRHSVETAEILH
jgi:hypothetical protein